MISSVLVANRGEIACRVFHTAAQMGLATVAVHSDPDTDARHVRAADAAVRLPGMSATDTYLRGDLIITAALRAGADAIHPGYGFLSENPEFAQAVLDAGLVWIGPPPAAIAAMGDKIEAKQLMESVGIPVLPRLDPALLREADLPVLVKAAAGGGGRGMRVVRTLVALEAQFEQAREEAQSAFGDPSVFCEPYLATARHIEVQVLADRHGTLWTLGERECSIQRRHQKIIEESPSPLVDRIPGLREHLLTAARQVAGAIKYVGAGTVEFIAAEDGQFYFLEMNTRLQVEHPVTECRTGLDLVEWQLRIADGAALAPDPPALQGYSIEARICAEDPAASWQPQSGVVHRFELPGIQREYGPLPSYGLRLDSGVAAGSAVSIHYDSMLAKTIAWAPTRDGAARILATTLARSQLHGVPTNRDLLVNLLRHKAFLDGDTDTAFFERHGLTQLSKPLADEQAVRHSALAAALADAAANRRAAHVLAELPSGWRNVASGGQRKRFGNTEIAYQFGRDSLVVDGFDDVQLVAATPHEVVLRIAGVQTRFGVARYGDLVCVDSPLGPVTLHAAARFPEPVAQIQAGTLLAPMPATVARIAAVEGEGVTSGQPLMWLEAMKMQHQVDAPTDGVLTRLMVRAGQQVEFGAVLAIVATDTDPGVVSEEKE